jgi:WD40 repeat protein
MKHMDQCTSVCWVDDLHFISSGGDKYIYFCHVSGAEVHHWNFPSKIQDTGVTPDGRYMIVVNSDRHIKVIDLASLAEVYNLPESDAVTSICVSRTCAQVLVNIQMIAKDPVIRLWDLTERRVKQRFFGHHQGRFVVRSAFGGPREQFVISGSEDTQVYVWHRYFGSLLEVISGHGSTVNCVCWPFVPSGKSHRVYLISASDDHTLRVWDRDVSNSRRVPLKETPEGEEVEEAEESSA